jgi:hypothetical protein
MIPITAFLRKLPLPLLLSLLLVSCAWPHQAMGQSAQTQPNAPSQLKPLSLPQLYWSFLSYQNHLDTLAAQLQAKGQDAGWMRDDLQKKLGFSDADFTPIRTSSQRLTSKMTKLSEQVKQIQASGSSMSASAQSSVLTALTKQRQADLDSEIYNLTLELSAENKTSLEKFIKDFFAPKKIAFRAPVSSGLSTGKAAQK